MKKTLMIIFMVIQITVITQAWDYPEHRDITLHAIQKLDPAHRAELENLWSLARKGFESRLSESVADDMQSVKPKYLDYAAWPAIAGDHSTSSENMLFNILYTDWILDVADIAASLKIGIANAKTRSTRINKLRDSDIRLLRADREYVYRGSENNGHFMLALPEVNTSANAYFDTCFKEYCAINLVGIYIWYHASALVKASWLSTQVLSPEQRSELTLSALADEAFALHFLEDGFAAGHVAGIWGDASQRKGTHDYYNERGLKVTTWKGDRMVLMGDAYMKPEDEERTSYVVLLSLEQILDEANGKEETWHIKTEPGLLTPDTLNVAKAVYMPSRNLDAAVLGLTKLILINTAVPGLATGYGELPRFRSEIGPFIGISPAARLSFLGSGFGKTQNNSGVVPSLELAFRIGLGMDGALNESGDGLVFLELGWRLDGASTMKINKDPSITQFGAIYSAIPGRDAYYARFRMPFFLIPGDLLIAGPFLLLASPNTLKKMIAAAVNGGIIPWQSGIVTPIGRFQFILGREVGVCLYGIGGYPDTFIIPTNANSGSGILTSIQSTQIDFPFLEYRPMRTFSSRQSASLILQITAGMDIPGEVHAKYPQGIVAPSVKTIGFIGLRLAFDWRYYFSKSKT